MEVGLREGIVVRGEQKESPAVTLVPNAFSTFKWMKKGFVNTLLQIVACRNSQKKGIVRLGHQIECLAAQSSALAAPWVKKLPH